MIAMGKGARSIRASTPRNQDRHEADANNDDPRLHLEPDEQNEGGERNEEVGYGVDRCRPKRTVERGGQDSDNARVYAAKRRCNAWTAPQCVPERKHRAHEQQPGKKKRDQGSHAKQQWVSVGPHGCANVSRD